MCVGDERPLTSSPGEYVCICAPIVKQNDKWFWSTKSKKTWQSFTGLILFELQEVSDHIKVKEFSRHQCLTELSISFYKSVHVWINNRVWKCPCVKKKDRCREKERIKALFSKVAGNQQESDRDCWLEIGGPYYHCLPCWRALCRGKECPLPLTLPTPLSTGLTPPHIHSSHSPTICLSIFLSLCLHLVCLRLVAHFNIAYLNTTHGSILTFLILSPLHCQDAFNALLEGTRVVLIKKCQMMLFHLHCCFIFGFYSDGCRN